MMSWDRTSTWGSHWLILGWLKINVIACSVPDQSSVDPNGANQDFGLVKLWFLRRRFMQKSYMRIEREIVRIRSRSHRRCYYSIVKTTVEWSFHCITLLWLRRSEVRITVLLEPKVSVLMWCFSSVVVSDAVVQRGTCMARTPTKIKYCVP